LELGVRRSVWFLTVAGPLVLMSLLGLALLVRNSHRQRDLLLLWTLAAALTIAIPGRFHWYYFAGLFPAMALLVGSAASVPWPVRNVSTKRAALYTAIFSLSIVFSVGLNVDLYTQPSSVEKHIAKNGRLDRTREAQTPSVAAFVAARTQPDDTIYNIGHQGELYFYADRRPASRYFHEFPLRDDPNTIPQVVEDLERNRPVYIVDTMWPAYLHDPRVSYPFEIRPFLTANYEHEGTVYFDDELAEINPKAAETYYADIWRLRE
jgi:hypothetical protein